MVTAHPLRAPAATLPGPSRRITVEPIEVPVKTPPPAIPDPTPVEPSRDPAQPGRPAPAR